MIDIARTRQSKVHDSDQQWSVYHSDPDRSVNSKLPAYALASTLSQTLKKPRTPHAPITMPQAGANYSVCLASPSPSLTVPLSRQVAFFLLTLSKRHLLASSPHAHLPSHDSLPSNFLRTSSEPQPCVPCSSLSIPAIEFTIRNFPLDALSSPS